MENMFDVISFGSATVDILLKSIDFKLLPPGKGLPGPVICEAWGKKIEISRKMIASGGGGTNTAVGLSRLGLKASVSARIGNDAFSTIVENDLTKNSVTTDFLIKVENEETDLGIILIGPAGGRTIMACRGEARLEEENVKWDLLSSAWFHVASLEGNLSLAKKLFNYGVENKIKLSWNPGNKELLKKNEVMSLLSGIDVLVLNREETETLLSTRMNTEDFWPLIWKLPVKMFALTQGRGGAFIIIPPEKKKYFAPIYTAEVVEETGAGDAFVSGLLAALCYKKEAGEALLWGLANGAGAVTQFGAKKGLLTKKQLEEMVGEQGVKVTHEE